MIATNDRCWLAEGNEFHLVQAVALMVDTFTNNPNLVNNANRYKTQILSSLNRKKKNSESVLFF